MVVLEQRLDLRGISESLQASLKKRQSFARHFMTAMTRMIKPNYTRADDCAFDREIGAYRLFVACCILIRPFFATSW